jgi:uncharacterized surface protein with fasciclin (FAS1) repeats
MKKLIIFSFLFINTLLASAQKSDSAASSIKDTAVNKATTPVKTRIIEKTSMSPAKNLIQNLSGSDEFSVLMNAIKTASITETFESNGPFTFFAPDNKAFSKLAHGKLDTLLMPSHKQELINLLTYHAIAGKLSAKDIEKQIKSGNGRANFRTLSGGTLTARINENRNIVLADENGGQSIISRFDIQQNNGVLHVINAVLIPKKNL